MSGRTAVVRNRIATAGALTFGLVVLGTLPLTSSGSEPADVGLALKLERTLGDVQAGAVPVLSQALAPPKRAETEAERRERELLERLRAQQGTPSSQQQDPKTEPPLHGQNPHGQGTVGVVDVAPSSTRPQGGNPDGSDSGEEIVVGRARGEQNADGSYHGHITIVALFGQEILGVDTDPGETEAGPLDAVQQGILNPICDGSGNQVCVSAVTADSSTNQNGSTNRFSAAHVTIGGAEGIDVGAAESNGNISDDGTCQTSHGDSSVADARVGGQAVADVAKSSTDSKACKGAAPTQTNTSSVVGLGGQGVPLPDPGCADGTPDVVTGLPVVAPIVCNADEGNGAQAGAPYGTREALSVYVLEAGGAFAAKTTTSASESSAVAPPPQCSDRRDNDGDGVVDSADPGCLSGPNGTYNPNDDNETDEARPQCSDGADNDGDGVSDAADPGCHTDGNAGNPGSYNPNDNDERNARAPQCSDGTDNDGDGESDARDPGCLSGPGGAYNPNDDNERDASSAADDDDSDRPECSDDDDNDGDGRVDARDPGCLSGPGGRYNPDDDSEASSGPAQCSDGADNDGDGTEDEDDPGCHTDGNADNPASYDPNDDSEADARRESGAQLPVTGSDALMTMMAGLLLLGSGAELRRRSRPRDAS